MIKIDLHTHSIASPDGGIKPEHYDRALESGQLDCIATTDHNTIDVACSLHDSLGKHIIVGEEITTTNGELIGLFLKRSVAPRQSILATAQAIKAQGGLVYIPHPFETLRKGVSEASLNQIAELVDIVEVHNGRAVFQNRSPQAAAWARMNRKAVAASSDAHGHKGLGGTYTLVAELPTAQTLVKLLKKGRFVTNRPPLRTLLYPKIHRLHKRLSRTR